MGLFSKHAPPSYLAPDANYNYDAETASTLSQYSTDYKSPPAYTAGHYGAAAGPSMGPFHATTELQIDATGVTSSSSLCSQNPDPIPVFRAQPGSWASAVNYHAQPDYVSLRIKKNSNSCALVRGSDPRRIPLNATVYRWGPGRHPRIRLLPPHSSVSVEEAIQSEHLQCDQVEVKSSSMISRSQRMVTPYGKFQWRYAGRSERKEIFNSYNVLILERMADHTDGKKDKDWIRIAQFVRNDQFRTPGTSKWMAGNGGRLMLDLRLWAGEKGSSAGNVEAFAVASCICMLKREVDRMRDNTTAAIV